MYDKAQAQLIKNLRLYLDGNNYNRMIKHSIQIHYIQTLERMKWIILENKLVMLNRMLNKSMTIFKI